MKTHYIGGHSDADADTTHTAMKASWNHMRRESGLVGALSTYDRTHAGKNLSDRPHFGRFYLKLLVNAAQPAVLSDRPSPTDWLREASSQSIDLIRDLPVSQQSPWIGMRTDFLRLHSNLLSWCLAARRLELVPELLAAVQGWGLAEVAAEEAVTDVVALPPDGPLRRFLAARAELRELIAQLHAAAGTGGGDEPDGTRFAGPQAQYTAKLAEVQKLREDAACESGYAALAAARSGVTLNSLQSVLGTQEQVCLLFSHEDSAHALLFGREGAPVYLQMPELPGLVAEASRFERAISGRQAMRRNLAEEDDLLRKKAAEDLPDDTPSLTPEDLASFWSGQAAALKPAFWDRIEPHLLPGGTLILCTAGDLHDLSFEPGRSPVPAMVTRMPGLASFALARGLYGGQTAPATTSRTPPVLVRVDTLAEDIPLAVAEGPAAAQLWADLAPQVLVSHPSTWPASDTPPAGFLHWTGHGGLREGHAGTLRSVLALSGGDISEREVLSAPRVSEALLNVCVGGRSFDSVIEGNVLGVVSGFLRSGTRWVVASLPPLPDNWALLAGLLVAAGKAEGLSLPAALDRARHQLVMGGWSNAVTQAYADSLVVAVQSRLEGVLGRPRPSPAMIRIYVPWLQVTDAELAEMLKQPDALQVVQALTKRSALTISETLQRDGTPEGFERDTVRYGLTLFGA